MNNVGFDFRTSNVFCFSIKYQGQDKDTGLAQVERWSRLSINVVNVHQARLVLGWVTDGGFESRSHRLGIYSNQLPMLTQPGHPSGVGK